jgi:hypothetical protein
MLQDMVDNQEQHRMSKLEKRRKSKEDAWVAAEVARRERISNARAERAREARETKLAACEETLFATRLALDVYQSSGATALDTTLEDYARPPAPDVADKAYCDLHAKWLDLRDNDDLRFLESMVREPAQSLRLKLDAFNIDVFSQRKLRLAQLLPSLKSLFEVAGRSADLFIVRSTAPDFTACCQRHGVDRDVVETVPAYSRHWADSMQSWPIYALEELERRLRSAIDAMDRVTIDVL